MATKIRLVDLDTVYSHKAKHIRECIDEFEMKRNDTSFILKKDNCIYIFESNKSSIDDLFDSALFCFLIDTNSIAYTCDFDVIRKEFTINKDENEMDYINCEDILENFVNGKSFPVESRDVYGRHYKKSAKVVDGVLIIENL